MCNMQNKMKLVHEFKFCLLIINAVQDFQLSSSWKLFYKNNSDKNLYMFYLDNA